MTTLTTARVRAATGQAALTALGTGGTIAALLVVLVAGLLRGAVLGPLTSLRRAIREATEGDLDATVPLVGPRELREVAEGFGQMTRTVAEQNARLEALAASDPLTGLANHRRFHETLEAAIDAARRAAGSVAVVTLDLDHFKQLNDEQGHPCGDEVLRATAGALGTVVRGDDLVARVGGEEFAPRAARRRARAGLAGRGARAGGRGADPGAGLRAHRLGRHRRASPSTPRTRPPCSSAPTARSTRPSEGAGTRRAATTIVRARRSFSDRERAEVVDVLRRTDAIMPVFQPLVDLGSGRLVGYEALSRFAALPPARRTRGSPRPAAAASGTSSRPPR